MMKRKNPKIVDIEQEKKILAAKKKAEALMEAEEMKDYHLGLLDNGTKDFIKTIFMIIASIGIGIMFSFIFYNVFNNVALNNLNDKSDYMLGILPYTLGLIQIFLTFIKGKIGLLCKGFGAGFLGVHVSLIFEAIKNYIGKEEVSTAFIKAMEISKNGTEIYSYLIVLLSIYFIVMFLNIALGLKHIVNDLSE